MKFRMPNVEFYLNQRQARGYSGDLGYLSVIWGWNNYQLESDFFRSLASFGPHGALHPVSRQVPSGGRVHATQLLHR